MRTISRPAALAAAVLSLGLGTLAATGGPRPDVAAAAATQPVCADQVPQTPLEDNGQSATGAVTHIGSLKSIYDPDGSTMAQIPALYGFDGGTATAPSRTIRAFFAKNIDDVLPEDEYVSGELTSTDGGLSFPVAKSYVGPEPAGMHTVRLRNGDLFSISFRPLASSTSTVATFLTRRLPTNATDWKEGTMTWTAPPGRKVVKGTGRPPTVRISGAPLELGDGTIVVPTYAHYGTQRPDNSWESIGGNTAELAQSTDGGVTFTRRSTIAGVNPNDPGANPDDKTGGNSESFVSRRSDGALIAVVRRDYNNTTGVRPLRQTVSTDDGLTWSPLTTTQVDFGAGAAGRPGINPQVVLMPNGLLALSAGRDDTEVGDNWVAISADGLGTSWKGSLTFRNCDVIPDSGRFPGSSGNTGLTWSDADTLVQATDTCHVTPTGNSCAGPSSEYTEGNDHEIYRRIVHALIPGVGKIDLAGKIRSGAVTVTRNMTYTSANHPRTGVLGAFDGSTEYWSSAVSAGGPGTMTLALDKVYDINRIGWSLRTGLPESARVSFSLDGSTWTQVIDGPNRTHYSLRYTSKTPAIPAKFVKIEVDASTDCETELGTSCAFLNEFTLFSTADSFENDVLQARPRGWTGLDSCYVSAAQADASSQGLLCRDTSDKGQATARYLTAAAPAKSVELRIKPVDVPHAVLFGIRGKNASGAEVQAFHLGISALGELKWHDGSQWIQIAPPGTIQEGSWRTLSLTASSTTTATLRLDGQVISSTIGNYQPATSLLGLSLASGGTVPEGDAFGIDDVIVQ